MDFLPGSSCAVEGNRVLTYKRGPRHELDLDIDDVLEEISPSRGVHDQHHMQYAMNDAE